MAFTATDCRRGVYAKCTSSELSLILDHPVQNALGAVEAPSEPRVEVVISTPEENGCFVVLEVADNGKGFPVDHQDHSSLPPSRRPGGGEGGRYLRAVLDRVKGSLAWENRVEGGAVVRISIPAERT